MAKTTNVFARVEPELKEQAEQILGQLGISMSSAVGIFLNQVVLRRGLPFEVKLPNTPLAIGSLTKEQLDMELQKGYDDYASGRSLPADQAFLALEAEFANG